MEDRYCDFTSLILNINRSIQKIKNMEMEELGLKGNQVQCMYYLFSSPEGVQLSELCKLCFEDKGAMSRAIHDLEERGYVQLLELDKKYKNPIKLTQSGQELGKKISAKVVEMVQRGSDGIKPEERETFYRHLRLVDNNLRKVTSTYGK